MFREEEDLKQCI